MPRRVRMGPGVTVDHVTAGPAEVVSKDALLPYMDDFAADLHRQWCAPAPGRGARALLDERATRRSRPPGRSASPSCRPSTRSASSSSGTRAPRDTSPPERIAVEERLVRECDRIVATCSDEVFELLRLGGDRRRISVVPCGVDLATFRPGGPADERDARPAPAGVRRPARGAQGHRQRHLRDRRAGRPAARTPSCVVAGGPDAADARRRPGGRPAARARPHRRTSRTACDFRGRVGRAELPPLLRCADVVVCVPWYEPFGIVPLEAMACGVPVVATAVGGLIDTVVDGVTGVLVPPRRPDEAGRRAARAAAGRGPPRPRTAAAGATARPCPLLLGAGRRVRPSRRTTTCCRSTWQTMAEEEA